MMPGFFIVKNTVLGPDHTSSTVIKSLHKQAEFSAPCGWTLKWWQRTITTRDKSGKTSAKDFKRRYLIHTDGTVITAQSRAWMDTAGVCMWIDVQLSPLQKASGRKWLLVWDNCTCHCTEAVLSVFKEKGILMELLPKNMTDSLQVMDLVVNGPIKSYVRRARAKMLYDYFQEWKELINTIL